MRIARARQLLHEIETLKRMQARGAILRPAQAVKLAREAALRICLGDRRTPTSGTLEAALGLWQFPNPL
eukprot:1595134-Lingulodinium_polyedra.AAC.1